VAGPSLLRVCYCREKSEQLARLEEFPRDVLLRSLFEAAAHICTQKEDRYHAFAQGKGQLGCQNAERVIRRLTCNFALAVLHACQKLLYTHVVASST